MLDLKNRKIYLASKSPRRSELMKQANIPFEIYIHEVDETYGNDIPTEKVPSYLAELKATACMKILKRDSDILIGADSVVICNGEIIGKPIDRSDAMNILSKLSDRWHTVITGVCILSPSKKVVFSESAEVLFYPLTDEEIVYYVDHFNPMDKAGAYGIQDWIGLCKVREIRGNFSNIMGLPMSRLYHELKEFIGDGN